MTKEKLQAFTNRMLDEARLSINKNHTVYHNPCDYALLRGRLLTLLKMLGKHGEFWNSSLPDSTNTSMNAHAMYGTALSIKEAIDNDLLVTVENMVMAETFSDLLEQADYLLSSGYFLAAGVLGRAVLEEHLRKWCERQKCLPAKPRTTLNDYYTELYKAQHLSKLDMKHVESLVAIGNEAAHNTGKAKADDVTRLLANVRDFVTKHPVS